MIVCRTTSQGHHCCMRVTLYLGTTLLRASQNWLLQGHMTDMCKAPCQSHLLKNSLAVMALVTPCAVVTYDSYTTNILLYYARMSLQKEDYVRSWLESDPTSSPDVQTENSQVD